MCVYVRMHTYMCNKVYMWRDDIYIYILNCKYVMHIYIYIYIYRQYINICTLIRIVELEYVGMCTFVCARGGACVRAHM